jgi:hypothetical protein
MATAARIATIQVRRRETTQHHEPPSIELVTVTVTASIRGCLSVHPRPIRVNRLREPLRRSGVAPSVEGLNRTPATDN